MRYRACLTCGRITNGTYCSEHQPAPRKNFRERGYGAEFERNRKRRLKLNPNCACGAPANTAHHIVDKRFGGDDSLANLESMCQPCHSRHTAQTLPAGWNAKR